MQCDAARRHKPRHIRRLGMTVELRREAGRMVNAWMALDRVAESAGASKLSREVWEVTLAGGSVAAIVPTDCHAALVNAEGREVAVYTLEEIGRLLSAHPHIAKTKKVFPGGDRDRS